jgi:tRNA nucleotidyltransferase (CCA-adding enzyme)
MKSSKYDKILSQVLKRITPNKEERNRVLALAEQITHQVEQHARKSGLDAQVCVEGSIAKDTWLRQEPDIDVFVRVPPTVPRKLFRTKYLEVARQATKGARQIERFAEHPYLEAILNGTRINIVPCYKVRKNEWKSATDRTPFHTRYVKPRMNSKLAGQVRLLKAFMKGISGYGAEIEIGGFSGYLCELLILFYRSFLSTLRAASNWQTPTIIDLENHYGGNTDELKRAFQAPIVVFDPVDEKRNAASAVRKDKLSLFIAASRAFLDKPRTEFFQPPQMLPFKPDRLINILRERGTTLTFIISTVPETVPDILWGQLYKSERSIRNLVSQHDFEIFRSAAWTDLKNRIVFVLEVQNQHLPKLKKHLGPPLRKKEECRRFLSKYISSEKTLSGPRIEGSRWIVDIKRNYTNIIDLLEDKLKDGGKNLGIAETIAEAAAHSLQILVNAEILPIYARDEKFSSFLTRYLKGQPPWFP